MKIPTDTFEMLRDAINHLDTVIARRHYVAGNFPRSDKVKDLDKRYRWDLFWIALRMNSDLRLVIFVGGYNDAHIDTALRRIVPPLTQGAAHAHETLT